MDQSCGLILHRQLAESDAAVILDGPTLAARYLKAQAFEVDSLIPSGACGFENMEWTGYSDNASAENDTFVLTVVGIPKGAVNGSANYPRAQVLLEATCTIGTSGATGLNTSHPVTGATSSTVWQQVDTIVVSRNNSAYVVYDSGANGQAHVIHDAAGYAYLFAFATSMSGDAENLIIVARPVSRLGKSLA